MSKKRVNVVGLGYIGLPTAALLAGYGYDVIGTDTNADVVDTINRGDIHIVEPGLASYVGTAVESGNLQASTSPEPADVFVVCVPTPMTIINGSPVPDLSYVEAAIASIIPFLRKGSLVILESTSPVGTTRKVMSQMMAAGVEVDDIHLAYCPERVLPGNVMTELVENDRVVGGITDAATKNAAEFYRSFVAGTVNETTAETAEMCKLVENSFRDVNIAFANEISLMCQPAGVDVWDLIRLANLHPRVNILQPGTGVGGHCIAVDPWFLVAQDAENSQLIRCARERNDGKTQWVIDQIKSEEVRFEESHGRKPLIACLGASFKPDIDDLRGSPALSVIEELGAAGSRVVTVEPNLESHEELDLISLSDALSTADLIVILVKHSEFTSSSTRQTLTDRKAMDFCGALRGD